MLDKGKLLEFLEKHNSNEQISLIINQIKAGEFDVQGEYAKVIRTGYKRHEIDQELWRYLESDAEGDK